jgi:penicillin-binding protein 2
MFVRPIQAEYPPGSIFKLVNALIAQQYGLINENTVFSCPGGYRYGRKGFMGCTHVHGAVALRKSISESCNTYYGYAYSRMIDFAGMRPVNAFKRWRNSVSAFGVGSKLGIDLPGERNGLLPSDELYTKRFKSDRWGSAFTISLSIGQGELGITPLQMANIAAIVANRGFFYKPHLIKAIGENKIIKEEFVKKNDAGIKPQYFKTVIDGMSDVVNQPNGTAWYSKIVDIEMCGKTGTVQNPHGKDHSVFIAFAPRDNPKIAIAVVVENAGYGATWSAPIASLMVEKYIKKSISRPQIYVDRILEANLLPGAAVKSKPKNKSVSDSIAAKQINTPKKDNVKNE